MASKVLVYSLAQPVSQVLVQVSVSSSLPSSQVSPNSSLPLPHTEDMPVFAHLMACYDACKSDQPVLRVHHHGGSRRNDVAAALAQPGDPA